MTGTYGPPSETLPNLSQSGAGTALPTGRDGP